MAKNPAATGRIAQIRQTYSLTRRVDPSIQWLLPLTFLGTLFVFAMLAAILLGGVWQYGVILGIPFAILGSTWLFGSRAEKAAYASIADQPGAAAAALNSLRKGWYVTPFIEVTKQQDAVHRVVGRPGVILVAEAPASRAAAVLATARARTTRFAGEAPIHEIVCGEGGVPLAKLNRAVMKLPRMLPASEVTELRRRLDAAQKGPTLPIPRGPLPKGMRVPRVK